MNSILIYISQLIDPNVYNIPKIEPGPAQAQNLFSLVFLFAAAVSVIVVVIGGLNYTLSNGDPQRTAKAKDTILYSVIGLVVSIFAFVIVRFVIGNII